MSMKKKIAPKRNISVEAQEKALEQLQQTENKKKVQRVTVDFPRFIYEQMKEETEMRGQTLKGFIVGLVRAHLAKRGGEG